MAESIRDSGYKIDFLSMKLRCRNINKIHLLISEGEKKT